MGSVQEQFNNCKSGDFLLPGGEYEGPLIINRSCIVDGLFSTLWSLNGPVLIIDAPGVVVKNLRIELTGGSKTLINMTAIETSFPDTKFEKVEVNGNITGIPEEAIEWKLPAMIKLGTFRAEASNTFLAEIEAAGEAKLINNIQDVFVTPSHIAKGKNTITITTGKIRDNTILYGEILVETKVIRRIYVMGRSQKDAAVHADISVQKENQPVQIELPCEVIAPTVSQADLEYLKRGQRISIKEYQDTLIKIAFEHGGLKKNIEIDGYVFLLNGTGRVRRDEDLIFFGNDASSDRAVKMSAANGLPIALVKLDKMAAEIERISICYSIYGEIASENFSLVNSPGIRIFCGEKEIYRYKLEDLNLEKTVVAIELYRYKGEWKINCVGRGYWNNLRTLCESFGVTIE